MSRRRNVSEVTLAICWLRGQFYGDLFRLVATVCLVR